MVPIDEIKKQYGCEHAFVVLLCRVFTGPATKDDLNLFIQQQQLDWEKVHFILFKQKIIPVASQILNEVNIPTDFKNKLKVDTLALTAKNIRYTGELLRLYNLLRNKGISVFPYKGPVFAQQYFGNTSLRQFSDIDFLVPIGNYTELEQLINIMTNDGYISMYSIPRGYRDYILKNTCEYYFDKYENNDRKFHAEFHWLGHHPVFDLPERLPIEILLENPETIYILGRPVETMNVRNNTLAIVLHHGVREQWSTMKHILDLAQIVKSGKLDLEEVLKICRQYHFSNALYLGLQLTDELLGMKCDISYEKHLDTKRFVEQVLGGKPRRHTVWYNQWQKIKILDGVVPKVKMLLKQVYYAFTPSILDYKFIALPKPLFFLYFLVKIVRRLLTGIKLQDR